REIAEALNARGIATPPGGQWYAQSVANIPGPLPVGPTVLRGPAHPDFKLLDLKGAGRRPAFNCCVRHQRPTGDERIHRLVGVSHGPCEPPPNAIGSKHAG